MTTRTRLTPAQQDKALQIVAAWLGKKGLGDPICPEGRALDNLARHTDDQSTCYRVQFGPAPTGHDAAMTATGPMLNREWDWPSAGPTPTILLEGGPYDWAVNASFDRGIIADMAKLGIFVEPYAGYALCLYPA